MYMNGKQKDTMLTRGSVQCHTVHSTNLRIASHSSAEIAYSEGHEVPKNTKVTH